MNERYDVDETATADEGGELDPSTAAALLEQTKRRAQRKFDTRPPLLMLIGAVVVLVAYGAVWWSVRRQHPYSGPSGTALAVLYTTLIVWVVVVARFFRRATSGVSGRSSRQRGAEGAAFASIWTAVYVFQGALYHAGASHAIVYGIYPAAAPLIIVGGAAASLQRREGELALAGLRPRRGRPCRSRRLRGPGGRVGCHRPRPLRDAPRPGYRPALAAQRIRAHA